MIRWLDEYQKWKWVQVNNLKEVNEAKVTEKMNLHFWKYSNVILWTKVDDISKVPKEKKRSVFFAVMWEMETHIRQWHQFVREKLVDLSLNFDRYYLQNIYKNNIAKILDSWELKISKENTDKMIEKWKNLMSLLLDKTSKISDVSNNSKEKNVLKAV